MQQYEHTVVSKLNNYKKENKSLRTEHHEYQSKIAEQGSKIKLLNR